jgi:hypothetical protein
LQPKRLELLALERLVDLRYGEERVLFLDMAFPDRRPPHPGYLLPREGTLEDVLGDVDRGVFEKISARFESLAPGVRVLPKIMRSTYLEVLFDRMRRDGEKVTDVARHVRVWGYYYVGR